MPRAAPVMTMTFPSTFMVSLRRLDAEILGNGRDLLPLLLRCLTEFRRPANVEDLSGCHEPLADHRIGSNDRANICGDALANFIRHVGWPEQADETIKGELAVARLLDRGNVGRGGSAHAISDCQQLDFSGLKLRPYDR